MEYSLYWSHDDNKIHLAFHERGTHRKTSIAHSSIERPEIFAEAQRIVEELNAKHAEARTYQSLLIRCNQQGSVSAALFENGKSHPKMELLNDQLNEFFNLCFIHITNIFSNLFTIVHGNYGWN